MKKYQTKYRMFVSYMLVPLSILIVITAIFTCGYYRTSKKKVLSFENQTAENANIQLKNIMDNLLQTASQYSMTPWVERLKYMQKIPDIMEKSITASDISDYASSITLSEINDSIVESIYIYYSIGEFGISSYGKSDWKKFVSVCQMQSRDEQFLSGEMLKENNQRTIIHQVSMRRNNKEVTGFCMIQTIPLENTYSGEVNILFFVPYENIGSYIGKFLDEGIEQFYLTDGTKILCAMKEKATQLEQGSTMPEAKTGIAGFWYDQTMQTWMSEYVKTGMDIGLVLTLDQEALYSDFYAFLQWIVVCCLILFGMILFTAWHMTKYNYQPLEHIMNMLDEQEADTIDEYALIEKAIRELDSQKKRLEVAVYEQNPLIEQYLLHTLLREKRMSAEEKKYINTIRQYANFRILLMQDNMEARQYAAEIDAALAVYPQIHTAFLKAEKGFLWVLSYGEEQLMEEIVELLQQTFRELEYKNAVFGLSAAHEDILEIEEALEQAAKALNYHFFWPEQFVVCYDEARISEHENSSDRFLVTEAEKDAVRHGLDEMDAEAVAEAYRKILLRNFRECMLSATALLEGIRTLNSDLVQMVPKKDQMNLNEQAELMKPENFSNFENYLQTFQIRISNYMERSMIRENPLYAAKNKVIREYVDSHLTDANLSLNETARVMCYTPTYFGKYFKEQFGCAFQQYVAVRRVERAKEYLKNDLDGKKWSISEIALECGFTNDVTFRRTFKRYTGMTPSRFEKE